MYVFKAKILLIFFNYTIEIYIFVVNKFKILIMNKLICAITIIVIMVSCKNENESVDSNIKKERAKMEKMTVKIKGMTCAIGCAKTIENKLNELEGVQKAKVDFNSKLATIEYDGSIHSKESLVKFIQGIADGKTYKVE